MNQIIIDELFEGEYALFMIGMLLSLILLICLFLPFLIGFTLRRHIRISAEGLKALRGDEVDVAADTPENQRALDEWLLTSELRALARALSHRGLSVAWEPGESGEMSDGGPLVTYDAGRGAVLLVQPSAERFELVLSLNEDDPSQRRLLLSSDQLERERVDQRRISVLEAAGAGWVLLTIDAVGEQLAPKSFSWGQSSSGPWHAHPVSALQRRLLRLSPWR